MQPSRASIIIAFLFIVLAVLLSFFGLQPSGSQTDATVAQKMELKRVRQHVDAMCTAPHFVGTQEHGRVGQYIIDQLEGMGLDVRLQEKMVFYPKWRAAVNVRNIMARIKGAEVGKALLLLSHYDSAPVPSLGASDDASGVAVILEAIRAMIEEGQSARNDIIVLFTDAEELGLMGAKGFVNGHPWVRDVGLVLNFEARGSGGPSYMLMETNGGNQKMLREFMRAGPGFPLASSLMYSIYKMLPNDTDLTVFREDGDIEGFNFAFIGDHFDYHTSQDRPSRLDQGTLVHQMDYLASTLRYFKDADLTSLKSGEDDVYFNIPFVGLFNYPFSWVWPMVFLALLLTLLLFYNGVRMGKIRGVNVLYSVFVHLLLVLAASLLGAGFWWMMKKIHPHYEDILHGFTYNGYIYIGVVASGALLLWSGAFYYLLKRKTLYEIVMGPVVLWLLINVLIAGYLKGGGYFVLPLLLLLTGLNLSLVLKIPGRYKYWVVLFSSLLGVVIFAPLIQMFVVGLGLKLLFLCGGLTILTLGFVEPVAYVFNMKWLMVGTAALFVFLLVQAELHSQWNHPDRKQPDGLAYLYDGDRGEAWWLTFNRHPDDWLVSAMGENIKKGYPDNINFMTKYHTQIQYYNSAPKIEIPKPDISLESNDTLYPGRTLYTLHYAPGRAVNKITVVDPSALQYTYLSINGVSTGVPQRDSVVIRVRGANELINYYVTPTSPNLEISFMTLGDRKPSLHLYEMSFDLDVNDALEVPPMPDYVMPMPFVNSNAVMAKYTVNFESIKEE